jgi:uncharacterized protein YndB with AHSA1/START domain
MTETRTPETKTLVLERRLPHALDKVWRALTQSELIADWLMPNDFEPVVGKAFTLRTNPTPHWNGIVTGEVLAVEPMSRLVYSWYNMTVTLTLTPEPDGVLLRMEQAGFKDDNAYNGAQFGWTRFLGKLEEVVARA